MKDNRTVSLWERSEKTLAGPLTSDLSCDVCVVGAGIAGLTTAYLLREDGHDVVLVDGGEIGEGETHRTTAHLSNALDDRYQFIEESLGAEGAELGALSHTAAIDFIESVVQEKRIACDFRRLNGYLFTGPDHKQDFLQREFDAAYRAGLTNIYFVDRVPSVAMDTGPALVFPNQGQFHPLRYLSSLAREYMKMGGKLFTSTYVDGIEGGDKARVHTRAGRAVTCSSAVLATNVPTNSRLAIPLKQAAYRTYVLAARVPSDTVERALYWDTADPYHYVRTEPTGDGRTVWLIVGGEDHKTGQEVHADTRFLSLENWARRMFPQILSVDYRWSGQVLEPMDGMAYIGQEPGHDHNNIFVITGDSGQGMTHGTLGGLLISDLISGRENPWAKLYDPHRFSLGGVKEFVKENVNTALQYSDWITHGDVQSEEEISFNSGAVVRRGLTKIAVYRDFAGYLHECSAVCPHLNGIVRWNEVEKTWDCPCHGSRFDRFGKVINGPASHDLAPVTQEVSVQQREEIRGRTNLERRY